MDRETFVETFGRLFQGPTWVAERAYDQRPFTDTHDLRMAFQESLFSADRTEQRDLLSLLPGPGQRRRRGRHPRRGIGSATRASVGLTLLNDEDHEEFAHLTEAYRDRFGIPLIVSVRDVEKRDQILKSGWERMQNAPTQEYAAAVIEVAKIANHRFDDLVADASPILGARAANLEAATRCPRRTDRGTRPTSEQTDGPATVQRACPTPRPGRPCSPAWTCPAGSTTSPSGRPYAIGADGAASGPGRRGLVHRRGDRRGAGPAPHGSASRPAPGHDAEFSDTGAGRRRRRRPGRHRGDPGRQRRVREPVRPGLPDQGRRPAGHRDPGRTAPPAEQHPGGRDAPRWSPSCGRSRSPGWKRCWPDRRHTAPEPE